MNDIPPLGWAALACLGIVFAVVNVGLIAMLRNRDPNRFNQAIKMPRDGSRQVIAARTVIDVLRDPFAPQRAQMDQLSRQVSELIHLTGNDDTPHPPNP